MDNGATGRRSGICSADGDELSEPVSVQMLVAFRVPDGVTAPPSFPSDTQDTTFTFSQSYTDGLTAMLHSRARRALGRVHLRLQGQSRPGDQAGRSRVRGARRVRPPAAADGGPFAGPLKYQITPAWRGGFAFESTNSGDPVTCDGSGPHFTLCADTPADAAPATATTPAIFPANLSKPVSDFGVLAGSQATAPQGGTATVAFSSSTSTAADSAPRTSR